ncbi:FAS-associated factor 2 [Psilocybe cubensis]|uniref:FAS-associated factor 2 n=2 Tax=Psilocybe cubensis TaxID=181762 RepID=A0ACB8GKK0_PSICU|nr:FAS-associated factor 2 [Psilocybe cubensis]KAH9475922.1 FAS-associated factor 2 [Psilocybe cubensis]
MSGLSAKQEEAVAQLRELIGGADADADVATNVLRSVDWDVERAADFLFGNAGSAPEASASTSASGSSSSAARGGAPRMEEFDIDDSQQGEFENAHRAREHEHEHEPEYPPRQRNPPVPTAPNTFARPLLTLLTFPLHVLSSMFKFIFTILRIPVPQFRFMGMNLGLNLSLGGYRPLHSRGGAPGTSGPERWLRALEEETGAVAVSRRVQAKGSSTATADPGAGSSTLTSRAAAGSSTGANGIWEDGRKYLPDFTISTYEDFLRRCQNETKIGCIVLVSEEHDDVPEFKRSTLTDPAFVKALYDNDMLVWGGDVRDHEAWSASQKLQATTYPFVAFVALQPRRTAGVSSFTTTASSSTSTNPSTNPPTLTVLSRHQGPSLPHTSTPLAPAGPTAAHTLTHHITAQLLPRVTPYIAQLRAHAQSLVRERELRAEQDAAFARAARADKERIERRVREEKEREDEARRRAETERREVERQKREKEERVRKEEERMVWRRWARRVLVTGTGTDKTNDAGEKPLRVAIRLPSGARVVHTFPSSSSSTLTSLYALVDSHLIPPTHPASEDPSPPISMATSKESFTTLLESHIVQEQESALPSDKGPAAGFWPFLIVGAYPRAEIPWAPHTPLSAVEALRGGGQVVVELLRSPSEKTRSGSGTPRSSLNGERGTVQGNGSAGAQVDDDDDDGYATEESE